MYRSSDVRVCLVDDSGVCSMYVGWVTSMCMCVGVRGGGLGGTCFLP